MAERRDRDVEVEEQEAITEVEDAVEVSREVRWVKEEWQLKKRVKIMFRNGSSSSSLACSVYIGIYFHYFTAPHHPLYPCL